MRRFVFFLSLFILFPSLIFAAPEIKKTSFDLPSNLADFEFIKISLNPSAASAKISSQTPYEILDGQGHVLFADTKLNETIFKANATGLQIGQQIFQLDHVMVRSVTGAIKLDNRLYRYALIIWKEANGKISIVNEIPIEDYLKGVLPWESNPKWPAEALKAQAVAARTYALFKAIENQNAKFVLSKDVLSQVYGGKTAENSITNRIVEITRGQILLYKGKIFPAYFHSTCAGATTHAEYLWNVEPHPALEGVKCNFCWQSKHARWTNTFARADIEKKLKLRGVAVAGIQQIRPADLDESGRARFFEITHAKGKTKVHSNDFRLWVDPNKFKSTMITSVQKQGESFVFRGKGWGHGVGLCQYGMKGLAELGYDYPDILRYYYPGTEVASLETLETHSAASPKSWFKKAKSLLSAEE